MFDQCRSASDANEPGTSCHLYESPMQTYLCRYWLIRARNTMQAGGRGHWMGTDKHWALTQENAAGVPSETISTFTYLTVFSLTKRT